jgi:hypothetical protein
MAMDYVVPRRGATRARLINNLACPTLAKRPIASQCLFSRLSHPNKSYPSNSIPHLGIEPRALEKYRANGWPPPKTQAFSTSHSTAAPRGPFDAGTGGTGQKLGHLDQTVACFAAA